MGIYRVPLVWQMYGHMDVEAKSLHEAIKYALGPECPLPEGSYVDDSIMVDAKSFINLFTLDFSEPVKIVTESEEVGKEFQKL